MQECYYLPTPEVCLSVSKVQSIKIQ